MAEPVPLYEAVVMHTRGACRRCAEGSPWCDAHESFMRAGSEQCFTMMSWMDLAEKVEDVVRAYLS